MTAARRSWLAAPRVPAPDFLRPARGTPRSSGVLLAVAALVLLLSALDLRSAWQARQQARLAAATFVPPRAAEPAPPARGAAAGPAAPELQRLRRPWPEMLGAVEAAGGRDIDWLALEITDHGGLRLQGRAPGDAAAAAAAERLRRHPVWRDVLLARAERDGAAATRFEIGAQMQALQP